ncbi:MAG: hypothetical protein Q9202_007584 [Teloschistes flavicans]
MNDSFSDSRASFKNYDAIRPQPKPNEPDKVSISDDSLSVLRTLLFDSDNYDTSTLEKLVTVSYNLRQTRSIKETLNGSPSATSKSKKLWLNICILARLRETLSILRLEPNSATTKALLGKNWTMEKIERDFAKRQKQKLNVHAEVQLLIFLSADESSISGLIPYFGCSKVSCFMCNRFIESHERFTMKGCRGHLFKPWTAPRVDRLRPSQADRTAKALLSVQKEIKKRLKASVEGHIQHERTSILGSSSVASGRQEERSQRQLQIDRLKIEVEGDSFTEMFKRHDFKPEDEDVLKDFGFNNGLFGDDQSQLLGVYGGLYRSGKVSAEKIHEWRIGDILF